MLCCCSRRENQILPDEIKAGQQNIEPRKVVHDDEKAAKENKDVNENIVVDKKSDEEGNSSITEKEEANVILNIEVKQATLGELNCDEILKKLKTSEIDNNYIPTSDKNGQKFVFNMNKIRDKRVGSCLNPNPRTKNESSREEIPKSEFMKRITDNDFRDTLESSNPLKFAIRNRLMTMGAPQLKQFQSNIHISEDMKYIQ